MCSQSKVTANMTGGFKPDKVDACKTFHEYYLAKLISMNDEQLKKEARFWGIKRKEKRDCWFPKDPVLKLLTINKSFNELSKDSKIRAICNECATYYAFEQLKFHDDCEEDLKVQGTKKHAIFLNKRRRYIDEPKPEELDTPEKNRKHLAAVSHYDPTKSAHLLLKQAKVELIRDDETNAAWAKHITSPQLTAIVKARGERRSKAKRALGEAVVNIETLMAWARQIFTAHVFTEGQAGVAAGADGGRRLVTYLNPRYKMAAHPDKPKFIMINFTAKQRVPLESAASAADQQDDESDSSDSGSDDACEDLPNGSNNDTNIYSNEISLHKKDWKYEFEISGDVDKYLSMRDWVQGNYDWTKGPKVDKENVENFRTKVKSTMMQLEVLQPIINITTQTWGRFVVHDLRKLYPAYMIYQRQLRREVPLGDSHRQEAYKELLLHKSSNSSKDYLKYKHDPTATEPFMFGGIGNVNQAQAEGGSSKDASTEPESGSGSGSGTKRKAEAGNAPAATTEATEAGNATTAPAATTN
jgi:hypothetical protein